MTGRRLSTSPLVQLHHVTFVADDAASGAATSHLHVTFQLELPFEAEPMGFTSVSADRGSATATTSSDQHQTVWRSEGPSASIQIFQVSG